MSPASTVVCEDAARKVSLVKVCVQSCGRILFAFVSPYVVGKTRKTPMELCGW